MQELLDFERDVLDLIRVAKRRSLTEAELIRAGLALGGLHASSKFYSGSPVQSHGQVSSRVSEAVKKLVAELEASGHMRLVRRNLPPGFKL